MSGAPKRSPKKPPPRPRLTDRLGLWLSNGQYIDGLWVGSSEDAPRPALRRAEDALALIKRYSPLHYARVVRQLARLWVHVLPKPGACYLDSLNACILDERYILNEATTIERIAMSIVHEATHARLDAKGILYDEMLRARVEAACMRRERAFVADLPDNAQLQEEIERKLDYYTTNTGYFSDANSRERVTEGEIETLGYLGLPNWLARAALKLRPAISSMQKMMRRLRRPSNAGA